MAKVLIKLRQILHIQRFLKSDAGKSNRKFDGGGRDDRGFLDSDDILGLRIYVLCIFITVKKKFKHVHTRT